VSHASLSGDLEGPMVARCARCGSHTESHDHFCEACGAQLRPIEDEQSPATEAQRHELEDEGVGAVSDRGLRRSRNEDAIEVVGSPARSLAVVCDGVASTMSAHEASGAAARAVLVELEPLLDLGEFPGTEELDAHVARALLEARRLVAAVPFDATETGGLSPSTTLVAGIVGAGKAAVIHVGDSRAYWLPAEGDDAQLLTVDDTLAEELIAQGVPQDTAVAHPQAHTITRWIGGDAAAIEPAFSIFEVPAPGWLLLCTDGLWGYFETAPELARLAQSSSDWTPIGIARHLVDAAIAAGGQDNISAAILPVGPANLEVGSASEEQ
jgi:serine/threonine protein phosphatase PrpC